MCLPPSCGPPAWRASVHDGLSVTLVPEDDPGISPSKSVPFFLSTNVTLPQPAFANLSRNVARMVSWVPSYRPVIGSLFASHNLEPDQVILPAIEPSGFCLSMTTDQVPPVGLYRPEDA